MYEPSSSQEMASAYATWQAPGSPLIAIRHAVMEAIHREVSEVFAAVPRRGAETGGILLGVRDVDRILIEDFEPVPSEHRFGPSYRLSDADRELMEETLAWFRGDGARHLSVLGLYRSITTPEFGLRPEDEELVHTCSSGAEMLLLLIKPSRTGPSVADFFVGRDGRVEEASVPIPFPFDGIEPPSANGVVSEHPVDDLRDAHAHGREEVPQPFQSEPAGVVPGALASEPSTNPGQELEDYSAPESEPPAAVPKGAHQLEDPVSAPPALSWPAPRPRFLEQEPERTSKRNWLWYTIAAALGLVGGALGYLSLHPGDGAEQKAVRTARAPASTAPSATSPRTVEPRISDSGTPPVPGPAEPSHSAERVATDAAEVSPKTAMQVQAVLQRWSNALRRSDTREAARLYEPVVGTYFTQHDVAREEIARSIQQARSRYGRFEIYRISGVRLVPAGDNRVTATFRKHWQTAGYRKYAGEEQERLILVRKNGIWKIESEEQEQLYWQHKPR
ncbi:MAG: hypothetical protein U0Q18_11350 [Bryobacteraceae bacterium]